MPHSDRSPGRDAEKLYSAQEMSKYTFPFKILKPIFTSVIGTSKKQVACNSCYKLKVVCYCEWPQSL